MSDNAQVGIISAIYYCNIGVVIKCWEWYITVACLDITFDITEEVLVWFRGQVSNLTNVQEFLEW
jgi:hypothetical protein